MFVVCFVLFFPFRYSDGAPTVGWPMRGLPQITNVRVERAQRIDCSLSLQLSLTIFQLDRQYFVGMALFACVAYRTLNLRSLQFRLRCVWTCSLLMLFSISRFVFSSSSCADVDCKQYSDFWYWHKRRDNSFCLSYTTFYIELFNNDLSLSRPSSLCVCQQRFDVLSKTNSQ